MTKVKSKYIVILSLFLFGCNDHSKLIVIGDNHAIWSESIYLRGYRPSTGDKLQDQDIIRYAKLLKENKIRYSYLFAGPYLEDGHLPTYAFSKTAIRTVQLLKNYYPELLILPWIGGVQNKTVFLGDSSWNENALSDTKRLTEVLGVPGVHIDFEYILPGNAFLDSMIRAETAGDREAYAVNVNRFHKKLRDLIPDSFISSVVVATSPDTKPWKRKTTLAELKTLVRYVDQLSFLYYDTYLNDQEIFSNNCEILLKDIQSLKQTKDIQYLVAIGTFINTPFLQEYRNMKLESVTNSLKTVNQAAMEIGMVRSPVDGIAIFCDWETDDSEWKEFRQFMVRN